MSEAIAEMVIPGTYIEVRAEGLIGVGGIATGNVGIVGTAARGPIDTVVPLGSFAEVTDLFGPADPFGTPAEAATPLTLTRALEQCFAGGASNVFAVRIANGDPVAATATVPASATTNAFKLTASTPGSWGNDLVVKVIDQGADAVARWRLIVSYGSNVREAFEGGNVSQVRTALAASQLVVAGDPDANPANGNAGLTATTDPHIKLTGGTSLPNVTGAQVAAGLARLEDQPVNIVLVAGVGADRAAAPLLTHVERTENEGRERIAVLGARASGTPTDVSGVLADTQNVADKRVVLVAPGIKVQEAGVTSLTSLPPAYTAALVAGRLAALAPHISMTNQTLPIAELDVTYTSTALKNLLQNRVLLVRRKLGHQVVKGITTDTGAFKQISVRRIVDYAKAGVRLGADPYIGKLNNARVRAALQATLDGFLSQMVLDEMLTGYELAVTATRAQEINGIAAVAMTLQPTFSIDFIRVTMTLQ